MMFCTLATSKELVMDIVEEKEKQIAET